MKYKNLRYDLSKIGLKKIFKFYTLSEDKGLSAQLESYGFREPLNSKCYSFFVNREDKILDIGSNLGYFVILGGHAKKIICIEPINQIIPFLRKNIYQNNLKEKCTIINAAVTNTSEKIVSFEKKSSLNLSKIADNNSKKIEKVRSVNFKKIVNNYDINLIRMDLEGYEYDLLTRGVPKKINKISMEVHPNIFGQDKFYHLMSYLEKEGFYVKYYIEPFSERFYPYYTLLKNSRIIHLVSGVFSDLNIKGFLKLYQRGGSLLNKIYSRRGILHKRYLYLMMERK